MSVKTDLAWVVKGRVSARRRRQLTRVRLSSRRLTSRWRVLPDALIIGGQRCGTSSLYKYLSSHGQIVPSLRKETEFFSTSFTEGESWYRAHFPLRPRMAIAGSARRQGMISFEATPDYLLDPRAPRRAALLLPDVKLIVALRDPVARAYSHYGHNRRLGIESAPFAEALEAEEERIRGEFNRIAEDPSYPAKALRRYSYVTRGLYADQLSRWLQHYPRSQLLVVTTEDLFVDTQNVLNRIYEFLGLPPVVEQRFRNYSYISGQADHRAPMPGEARSWLEARFVAPNQSLADLVGLAHGWRPSPAAG